jgi:hypothetical protein
MRRVRRIERAAEQPDAQAGRMRRQHGAVELMRVCYASGTRRRELTIHGRLKQPLPRTFACRRFFRATQAEQKNIMAAFDRYRESGI